MWLAGADRSRSIFEIKIISSAITAGIEYCNI
jgi:hypothetical protein